MRTFQITAELQHKVILEIPDEAFEDCDEDDEGDVVWEVYADEYLSPDQDLFDLDFVEQK